MANNSDTERWDTIVLGTKSEEEMNMVRRIYDNMLIGYDPSFIVYEFNKITGRTITITQDINNRQTVITLI